MTNASVFIGRFQPFHLGHLFVMKKCPTDQIYIGIGSSQYHHTLHNPFTFKERKTMINTTLSNHVNIKYDIYAVDDIHDPDNWVEYVETIFPVFSLVLTNNEFTKQLFEEKGYKVHSPGLLHRNQYSGDIIRRRMIQGKSWAEFVPSPVASYLMEINAVERMQELSKENKE